MLAETLIKEEFDKNNNSVYLKYSESFEKWKEYDEKSRMIYKKTILRYHGSDRIIECWFRYDENDKRLRYKTYSHKKLPEKSRLFEYDEDNKEIHHLHSYDEGQSWYKYDEDRNEILTKEIY